VIVGVTSFGLNGNCVGGGFTYRIDIETSQNIISSFL